MIYETSRIYQVPNNCIQITQLQMKLSFGQKEITLTYKDKNRLYIEFDNSYWCDLNKPNRPLHKSLKDHFKNEADDVFNIIKKYHGIMRLEALSQVLEFYGFSDEEIQEARDLRKTEEVVGS